MKTSLLAITLASSISVGCATHRPAPVDVQIMPNDCANFAAINRWLENQRAVPRNHLQSQENYEHQQSQIRYRIWSLRYNCRPA
jgi:hypothetical protein